MNAIYNDTHEPSVQDLKNTFCKRLFMLRSEKEWTQYYLAKVSGVERNAIGRYELGDGTPAFESLARLARALDVTLDFLCGLED